MTTEPPVIDDFEKQVIIQAFRRSARIIDLAEAYQVPEEVIAEILGLPLDKKEQWEIFRDTCFYDHGFGDSQLDRRMEFYGEFLEDGDFEKWQPCCYMSHLNPIWQLKKFEANAIAESDDPKIEIRRLWILNRFTKYKSPEWDVLLEKIKQTLEKTGWKHPLGGPF